VPPEPTPEPSSPPTEAVPEGAVAPPPDGAAPAVAAPSPCPAPGPPEVVAVPSPAMPMLLPELPPPPPPQEPMRRLKARSIAGCQILLFITGLPKLRLASRFAVAIGASLLVLRERINVDPNARTFIVAVGIDRSRHCGRQLMVKHRPSRASQLLNRIAVHQTQSTRPIGALHQKRIVMQHIRYSGSKMIGDVVVKHEKRAAKVGQKHETRRLQGDPALSYPYQVQSDQFFENCAMCRLP
jgi:hypothetical protein